MSELRIEEGKWYRRRDGVVVGPAWHRESGRLFPWCLGEHETMRTIYMDDGRFDPGGCRAELDLVREVTVPLPQNPVEQVPAAPATAKLQIEEGKWYRRRDGAVVGPVRKRGPAETVWRFEVGGELYRENGSCVSWFNTIDLVEEVSAPLPQNPVDIAIAAEIDAETAATTFGPIEQHTPPDSAWQPADKAEADGVEVKEWPYRVLPTVEDGYEIKEVGDHSLDALVAARVFGALDDNPKTIVGRVKPALRAIPPIAILHLGGAMGDGESKYGRFNWRDNTVTSSVYYDAIQRHLLAWWDGENNASDSGRSHLAHIMACCAILLDAEAASKLNDDRRKESLASAYVAGEVAQISEP